MLDEIHLPPGSQNIEKQAAFLISFGFGFGFGFHKRL